MGVEGFDFKMAKWMRLSETLAADVKPLSVEDFSRWD